MTSKLSAVMATLALVGTTQAFAQHVDIPVMVPSPVEKVFVPLGFDDNDNTEIILHGTYPSTCYGNGPTSVKINDASKTIEVTSMSYFHVGSPCLHVMVPYIQSVKVGVLKPGDYSIEVKDSPDVKSEPLRIHAAIVESQDDYMYASVENVSVVTDDNNSQTLTLSGHHPLPLIGCVVLKDVKLVRSPGDVLVVLPISEYRNDDICKTAAAKTAFTYEKEITEPLAAESLVHVRTMQGNSMNYFFK